MSIETEFKQQSGTIGSIEWYNYHKTKAIQNNKPLQKKEDINLRNTVNSQEDNIRLNSSSPKQRLNRYYFNQKVRVNQKVLFCNECNEGFLVNIKYNHIKNCLKHRGQHKHLKQWIIKDKIFNDINKALEYKIKALDKLKGDLKELLKDYFKGTKNEFNTESERLYIKTKTKYDIQPYNTNTH